MQQEEAANVQVDETSKVDKEAIAQGKKLLKGMASKSRKKNPLCTDDKEKDPKKIKFCEDSLFDPQFDSFKGNPIEKWMGSISKSEMQIMLSSVCSNKIRSVDNTKEMVRQAKFALQNFETNLDYARMFVFEHLKSVPSLLVKYIGIDGIPGVKLETNPNYVSKFEFTGLKVSETPNELFYLFANNVSLTNVLPIHKMHSIIRSMYKTEYIRNKFPGNKVKDHIMNWISDKLVIPEQFEVSTEFCEQITWSLPYLQPYFLYIETDKPYRKMFMKCLKQLQSQILRNLQLYVDKLHLTKAQISGLKDARREWIRNEMRTNRIQAMFVSGHTKTDITNMLYKEYTDKYGEKEVDRLMITDSEIIQARTDREKNIKQSRKAKFAANMEFMTESVELNFGTFKDAVLLIFATYYLFQWAKRYIEPFERKYNEIKARVTKLLTFTESVEKTLDRFSALDFRSFSFSSKEDQCKLLEIKSIFHGCMYLYNNKYTDALHWFSNLAITRGASLFELCSSLSDKFSTEPDFQTESYGFTDIVGSLFAEIGLIGKTDEEIKRANNAYTYMRNSSSNAKDKLNMLKYVTSFITLTFFGVDFFDDNLKQVNATVVSFIEFMSTNNARFNKIGADADLTEAIIDWSLICKNLLRDPNLPKIHSKLFALFKSHYLELLKHEKVAIAWKYGNERRPCPVFIIISGDSGSGKSTFATILPSLIEYLDTGKEFGPEMLYVWNGSEYHEGYKNQKYTSMPDIFTSVDVQKRALIAEMINLMNSMDPCNLNMAFDDKGMTKYTSQFIIASSNLIRSANTHNLAIGLTDPNSFVRRIDIQVVRNNEAEDHMTDTYDVYIKPPKGEKIYVKKRLNIWEIAPIALAIRDRNVKHFKKTQITLEQLKAKYPYKIDFSKYYDQLMRDEVDTTFPMADQQDFPEPEPQAPNFVRPTWFTRFRDMLFQTQSTPAEEPTGDTQGLFDYLRDSRIGQVEELQFPETEERDVGYVSEESVGPDDLIGRLRDAFPCNETLCDPEVSQRLKEVFKHKILDPAYEQYPKLRPDLNNRHFNYRQNFERAQQRQRDKRNQYIDTQYNDQTKILRMLLKYKVFEGVKIALNILVVLFLFLLACSIFKSLYNVFATESFQYNKAIGLKKNQKKKLKKTYDDKKKFKKTSFKTESVETQRTKLVNGVFNMVSRHEKPQLCNGFHYRDGWCFISAHFIFQETDKGVRDFNIEFISSKGRRVEQTFTLEGYTEVSTLDLVAFKLPSHISLPRPLEDFFLPANQIPELADGHKLYRIGYNKNYEFEYNKWTLNSFGTTYSYYTEGRPIYFEDSITYNEETCKGMSGSIVYIEFNNTYRIVGIHAGQAAGKGVAMVVEKELFEELIEFETECSPTVSNNNPTFETTDSVSGSPVTSQGLFGFLKDSGIKNISKVKSDKESRASTDGEFSTQDVNVSTAFGLKIQSTVPIEMAHNAPQVNKIYPSPLFEWKDKTTCKPAHLRPFTNKEGAVINPWTKAFAKLHQEEFQTDYDRDLALAYLHETFHTKMATPEDKKVYDPEEVVNSIPGTTINGIVASTSAGWPFSVLEKGKGKSAYFDRDEDDQLVMKDFARKIVAQRNAELRAGKDIPVTWGDVLKGETLPNEKVDEGKARLFSTCPFDYLLLVRAYFGSFVDFIQRNVLTHPCAVGINPHGFDWTFLYHKLNAHTGSVIAGDFTNFDGKLPKQVGQTFLKFVNEFYDDEFSHVREILMSKIFNATHIHGCNIYQVADGNPSGNPLTAIYNSICNIIMCFTVLVLDLGLKVSDFQLIVYGDDNIMTTSKSGITCSMLAEFFLKRFGLVYTHWSKKDVECVDSLETISFLGRAFVLRNGRVYAPLKLTTVIEATYWIKTKNNNEILFNMCETFRSFQLELVHHGKEIFNRLVDEYLNVAKERLGKDANVLITLRRDYSILLHEMVHCSETPVRPWVETFIKSLPSRKNNNYLHVDTTEPVLFSTESVDSPKKLNPDSIVTTKNIQHTDRATNDPQDTQLVELGTYQDVNEVDHSHDMDIVVPRHNGLHNIESFDLNGILRREYPLGTFNWTTDHSMGHRLETFQFPQRLFNLPFLASKISDFSHFVGGVRISFRIAASRTLYGKLIASYMPYPDGDADAVLMATPGETTTLRQSGYPHVLISAASGETVSLDIKFINPKRALNLRTFVVNEIAQVYLSVLNKLTDISGVTNSAKVFVTAQFLDAKLYLPNHFTTESTEAARKGKAGIITKALEDVEPIADVLESVPFAAPAVKVFKRVSKTARPFLKMFGLNKPGTIATTEVMKVSPFHDLNTMQGIDTSVKYAADPENAVSTSPDFGLDGCDEMNLDYIICTPNISNVLTVVRDGNPLPIGSGLADTHCFLDLMAKNFHFRSGSVRFRGYITASHFQTIRLAIWLGSADSNFENCYHQIIEVQGDTTFDITIPFISDKFVVTSDDDDLIKLWIKPLAWSDMEPALNKPIYINVYKASAGDIKFGGQKDVLFRTECSPREDFKNISPTPLHPSHQTYSQKGIVLGEEINSVRELVHRNYPMRVINSTSTVDPYDLTYPLPGIMKFAPFFMFMRGSLRMKFIQKDTVPRTVQVFFRGTGAGAIVGSAISSTTNPVVEMELPWYSDYSFIHCRPTIANYPFRIRASCSATLPSFLFMSGGDDFSYLFLRLPYSGSYFNASGVQSTNAFFSFMTPA